MPASEPPSPPVDPPEHPDDPVRRFVETHCRGRPDLAVLPAAASPPGGGPRGDRARPADRHVHLVALPFLRCRGCGGPLTVPPPPWRAVDSTPCAAWMPWETRNAEFVHGCGAVNGLVQVLVCVAGRNAGPDPYATLRRAYEERIAPRVHEARSVAARLLFDRVTRRHAPSHIDEEPF